jgi:hypothetical protein
MPMCTTLPRQVEDVNARHSALCAERDSLTAEIETGTLTDEQIATMPTTFSEDMIEGPKHATF